MDNILSNIKISGRIKKIFITGSNGQISRELLPYLNKLYGEENIICSDVFAMSEWNFPNKWIKLDILDKVKAEEAITEFKPDIVLHNAAILSAVAEVKQELAIDVNIIGFINILNICKKLNIIMFTPSSVAAFGPSSPRDETPNECEMKPKSIYGITKVFTELLGSYYTGKDQLDFRSIRYPIVISPTPALFGSAMYSVQIFWDAIQNKKYKHYLKDETKLTFIYIEDLIRATLQFIEAPKENLRVTTYNIMSCSFTVKELTDAIKKRIPDFTTEYEGDYRQGVVDTWPRSLDDTYAQKDWGYKRQNTMEYIVDTMIKQIQLKIQKNEGYTNK